jgi:5,10-methylene-tetrahydrofolate dehydrogenase/methenyl tetrahydrofolate cyclohydrolase
VQSTILDKDAPEGDLIREIRKANADPSVHGILVLLPLPVHFDQEAIFQVIAPEKELEGLLGSDSDGNLNDELEGESAEGRLDDGNKKQSSTITAVRMLLESIDYEVARSRNVFLTEDDIRDNPLVARLLRMSSRVNVPVAVATTLDPNVRTITRNADLVLVSLASPEVVDDTFLKSGAVVIDFNPVMVGEKYSETKKRVVPVLKNGVNVAAALRRARFVAPSVGGVGPISVATMMRNLVLNCRQGAFNPARSVDHPISVPVQRPATL